MERGKIRGKEKRVTRCESRQGQEKVKEETGRRWGKGKEGRMERMAKGRRNITGKEGQSSK